MTQLKRYSIENVYRENRLADADVHPRELAACSFDIVSPSYPSLVPDAEVIAVVAEIVAQMKPVAGSYKLRLNHTALVRAVLLHCGIAESLHNEVYAILGNSKVFHIIFAFPSSGTIILKNV